MRWTLDGEYLERWKDEKNIKLPATFDLDLFVLQQSDFDFQCCIITFICWISVLSTYVTLHALSSKYRLADPLPNLPLGISHERNRTSWNIESKMSILKIWRRRAGCSISWSRFLKLGVRVPWRWFWWRHCSKPLDSDWGTSADLLTIVPQFKA